MRLRSPFFWTKKWRRERDSNAVRKCENEFILGGGVLIRVFPDLRLEMLVTIWETLPEEVREKVYAMIQESGVLP